MDFFDSHAHYNDEKFDIDRDKLLKNLYKEGIKNIINAGYDINSSKKALEIANKYDFIYASVGISPNDLEGYKKEDLEQVINIAKDKKIVAIGEIGLDYYWNKENTKMQKEIFIEQINIANNLNLPIIIHTREAIYDTLDILKNKINCKKKGVFHCCPLNTELIKEALKLEFYISLAGPITYKNSKNAEEIIKQVPYEKMLIETDCPYLSPEPLRGKRNDSGNIKYIAQKIADVKGIPIEKLANITYKNTKALFNIN